MLPANYIPPLQATGPVQFRPDGPVYQSYSARIPGKKDLRLFWSPLLERFIPITEPCPMTREAFA